MSATWDPCTSHLLHFPSPSISSFQSSLVFSTSQTSPLFPTPITSPTFPISSVYSSCDLSHSTASNQSEDMKPETRKMRTRRYKTPSPQLLRSRRSAANERERRRMLMLNLAYDKLRTVLPEMDSGRRLSKFETLLMAQQYIEGLSKILRSPSSKH
ncbi:unnamed protein product, partial [Mesorhabditis belari]|uniref:BHLH domain-containing protein n=1 Tax=Mesorhabditis belari TaxID=2138241 RepID=A0AAF3EHD9_9BILA